MKNKSGAAAGMLWVLRLIDQKNRAFVLISGVLSMLKGVLNVAGGVWLLYRIVDAIQQERPVREIVAAAAVYALLGSAYHLLNQWFIRYRQPLLKLKVKQGLAEDVMNRSKLLPYRTYESAEEYDRLQRVQSFAETTVFKLFDSYLTLLKDIVMLVCGVLSAVAIDPALLCFAVLAFPSMFFGKRYGKASGEENVKTVRPVRVGDYILSAFFSRQQQRVIRSSEAGDVLRAHYEDSLNAQKELIRKRAKKMILLRFFYLFLSVDAVALVMYLYAAVRVAVEGSVSLAEVSVLMTATMTVISRTRRILDFSSVYARYRKEVETYRTFLSQEIAEEAEPFDEPLRSVEFRNVSFSYDGKKETLKNISFRVDAKEKIAIVGCNGAGKTTLIKLLLGLYPADRGTILINDCPIEQIPQQTRRRLFGVLFQDFYLFNIPLRDNILLGGENAQADGDLQPIVARAGLPYDAQELERDYGRLFTESGVVPSGGQSQRLAFARLLYGNAPVWILDEPTSALDPLAEEALYRDILSESNDKTVIFISHHLSSVKKVDRILVFQEGSLAEEGDHEALMRANGVYHQLFTLQAKLYAVQNAEGGEADA